MGYTSYLFSALRKGWYAFHSRESVTLCSRNFLVKFLYIYIKAVEVKKLLSIVYKML